MQMLLKHDQQRTNKKDPPPTFNVTIVQKKNYK